MPDSWTCTYTLSQLRSSIFVQPLAQSACLALQLLLMLHDAAHFTRIGITHLGLVVLDPNSPSTTKKTLQYDGSYW
jgi:hypothetical protein